MNIRWRVELSQDEREELTALLKSGRHAVRKVKRAQILLAADDGVGDGEGRGSRGSRRLDGLSHQAAFRGRQSGTRLGRGPAAPALSAS